MSTVDVNDHDEGPIPPKIKEEWLQPEDKGDWADVESTEGGDILYGTDFCDLGNETDSSGAKYSDTSEKGEKRGYHYGHVRSLSGHFQNATKISDPLDTSEAKHDSAPSYPCQELNSSSANAGKKHRRVFSGGGTNPSRAHRRINSRGKSAFINRHYNNSNMPTAQPKARKAQSLSPEPQNRPSEDSRRGRSLSPPPVQQVKGRGHRRKSSGGGTSLPPAAGPPMAAQWLEHMRNSPAFDNQNNWPARQHNGHGSYHYKDTSFQPSHGNGPTYPPPPQYFSSNPSKPPPHQYPPQPGQYYSPNPPPYPYPVESSPSPPYFDDSSLNQNQDPYKPPTQQGEHPFYYPPPRAYPIQKSKEYPMQQDFWRSSEQKAYEPMAPLSHPLAAEQLPLRPQRQSSLASSGSERIETDEPLFTSRASNRSSSPHYRISPQMFMQSMHSFRGSPSEFRPSPPSSVGYVRPDLFVPQNMNEPVPLEINPIPHRLDASPVSGSGDDTFIREVGKSSHKRTGTNDSLIQLQDTLGECLLPGLTHSDDEAKRMSTLRLSHSPVTSSTRKNGVRIPETNNANEKKKKDANPKRIRRKCTVEGCENRVVQGGLCISHGAKRKICGFPGCTKHVKKAGKIHFEIL